MNTLTLISRSPEETERLGRLLGSLLQPAMFVALNGELGGGKTCLTRGIVAAAAPESLRLVASPTFAIMNEYPGLVPVYHFDFYRLSSSAEIIELGFEDFFSGSGICIAEWSDRLGELIPPDRLAITMAHEGEESRRVTLQATGSRSEELLTQLAAMIKG